LEEPRRSTDHRITWFLENFWEKGKSRANLTKRELWVTVVKQGKKSKQTARKGNKLEAMVELWRRKGGVGVEANKRLHCAQVTQGGSSCSLHSCAATSPSTQLCLLVRRKHASEQLI